MRALLTAGVILAASTTFAANAQADTADQQFLQNIRKMGLEVSDQQELINTAHGLCDEMKQGKTYDTVVMEVRQNNEYWDAGEAAYFVSVSAQAYCPEMVAN
jgi:hypothetical protein